MSKKRKWTDDQLVESCKEARSIRQILNTLKLEPTGGNYSNIRKHIKRLDIKINFDNKNGNGQGWRKGSTTPVVCALPLETILVENRLTNTSDLKKRLIKEGYFEHVCSECKLTTWNGKPIPIHLDHINGTNTDNRIENLRLLCPNCHAQTDTYAGKNIGKYSSDERSKAKTVSQEYFDKGIPHKEEKSPKKKKDLKWRNVPKNPCKVCGHPVRDNKRIYCSYDCLHIANRKTKHPAKEELERLLTTEEHSFCYIGRLYGVSDNAVRKWAKKYGIPIKRHKDRKKS